MRTRAWTSYVISMSSFSLYLQEKRRGGEEATDMGGKNLVFGEHTVNRASQTGRLALRGDVLRDMVYSEVGTDPLADLPVLHGFAHGDDLSGHVGAGNRVLLLEEREFTLCDEEVTVLGG